MALLRPLTDNNLIAEVQNNLIELNLNQWEFEYTTLIYW